jgi:NCS1 family nucleobase:cation symporter-1
VLKFPAIAKPAPPAKMGATTFRQTASKKATVFKDAFRSREGFKYFIETRDTSLDKHGHNDSPQTWSNEDLDPTPPEKRTWRWWNYVTFYLGLSFGNWTLGSTMVGIGLNWWQSILVIFASQFISSVAMFFNSRCASVYHIGYPVVARSVFGMWGSYYFVGARAALAIIWYGVQRKFDLSCLMFMPDEPSLLWSKLYGEHSTMHFRTQLYRHPEPYS